MILSDEEAFERLNSGDNIINLVDVNKSAGSLKVVDTNDSNVGKRGPAVPDLIRRLIAQTANGSDETQAEIANVFGVGIPTVSNSARGLIHNRLDTGLQEIGLKTREEKTELAHNEALDSLVLSLGLVKDTIGEVTSAKEAAKLAVDMSRIVVNLRDKDNDGPKIKTLVIVSMPQQKKESQFETIDV